ncbi:Alkyl sulfatase BDS1, metallo-beta-lactamase superfamily [Saccharopolyspora antimicrobica]|uniref:Alkyl sulfatase BDS1, metallo-beta-lactamase superfamily n=1 Tax=Saccharopolyspora antimicrobica TaxID=455193 RepID=A0A1I4VB23_9PSEU|nr:alkyl sulfatase dimerization domain-containing protein [Saccharopolyspora antimicrobica]RKT86203.1 alkyl sulfatase BDS1-like metallo-beta-lactamase superfamily hydrolase [Saccharopolyspora antimicrobica]SFM98357.1 Alkyl sulfatase BDS1, metallo-beta-lactamase superfamily [Saccharopolyspora antimicrobica]
MKPLNRRKFVVGAGAAAAAMTLTSCTTTAGPVGGAGRRFPTDTTGLPYGDRTDFANADRGFLGALEPGKVKGEDGAVVYDADAYSFLAGEVPGTADPSLWRQGQLASRQGLYQVSDRIYQVRGLDLANMTFIEGDTGVIVIDTLTCNETAVAALGLYRAHRGDRAVTGVIYTHSHVDHFGGTEGILPPGHAVPVLAPEGFMEHAVVENVYAGTAMSRRAAYMYGDHLDIAPDGQIGCGLGQAVATGTSSLVPPTESITETGQRRTIDGVVIEFQLTPGTEAPSEMNLYFPQLKALCMAENVAHTMHNIITLRGAQVRDARQWSRYLSETIVRFGEEAEVLFGSHHWPTWGTEQLVGALAEQRDLYAYLHDQTLRLINQGHTGSEIAEFLELPPALQNAWATRGYYGSLNHNIKGIYQRYMGWFDGNPAHLWEHPPVEQSKRWVQVMGGVADGIKRAGDYAAQGDLRFAVTLLNHCVFAEPDNEKAKQELAKLYDRLGHGVEDAVWRNFYLTAAKELREGKKPTALSSSSPSMMAALTVDQLLDSIAIRVNGPKAWDRTITMDWKLTDENKIWHLRLANGVLTHHSDNTPDPAAQLTLSMTRPQLAGLLRQDLTGIDHRGDLTRLQALVEVLDEPDPDFSIVTP